MFAVLKVKSCWYKQTNTDKYLCVWATALSPVYLWSEPIIWVPSVCFDVQKDIVAFYMWVNFSVSV